MGFLQRITRQGALQQKDGTCWQVSEETFLEKVGTQPLGTYIYKRQATVADWVVLCPVLGGCDRETGYEGRGGFQETWCRQTAAINQLSSALKEILEAARERRWKSGRYGKSGGGDRDTKDS